MLKSLLIIFLSIHSISGFNFNSIILNRRDMLQLTSLSTTLPLITELNQEKPICVIGANGETGKECIKILTEQNKKVKAVSKKPIDIEYLPEHSKKLIECFQTDLRATSQIPEIVKDSSALIFLANAKKKYRYIKSDTEEFQNYEDIDVLALKNIATECIKQNVGRMVYISGACRACNENPALDIDKICGIECDNCRSKQIGENIIRKLYSTSDKKNVDYTIVRIGYLFNGENRGAPNLELNQDYTKSGMISRTDLANVCISSIYNQNTARATFEAYYRDTTQPYDVKDSLQKCTNLGKSVEECFFGSEYKDKKPTNMEEVRKKPVKGSLFTTGNEYQGNDWNELYKYVKKDKF